MNPVYFSTQKFSLKQACISSDLLMRLRRPETSKPHTGNPINVRLRGRCCQ